MNQQAFLMPVIKSLFAVSLAGFLSAGLANDTESEASKESRAKQATDDLTKAERESQMPLPGQGYSHSSLLLDKAKDKKAVDEKLEELEKDGKIKK